VVDSAIPPVINTGIAHKEPGIGQVGAGIAFAPLSPFATALGTLTTMLSAKQRKGPRSYSTHVRHAQLLKFVRNTHSKPILGLVKQLVKLVK
jgi:hypothetical protein